MGPLVCLPCDCQLHLPLADRRRRRVTVSGRHSLWIVFQLEIRPCTIERSGSSLPDNHDGGAPPSAHAERTPALRGLARLSPSVWRSLLPVAASTDSIGAKPSQCRVR